MKHVFKLYNFYCNVIYIGDEMESIERFEIERCRRVIYIGEYDRCWEIRSVFL